VAAIGFAGAWAAAHYTDLGMNAETTAIATPVALYVYREIRKRLGKEPS
jgi:hypothetical protein